MSLIEGVGDEVTVFFGVIFLLILLISAWLSTNVADRPFVSVVILDRQLFQRLLRRLRQQNFQVINISQFLSRNRGTDQSESPPATETTPSSAVSSSEAVVNTDESEVENTEQQSTSQIENNLTEQTVTEEAGGTVDGSSDHAVLPPGGECDNYPSAESSSSFEADSTSHIPLNTDVPSSEPELRRRRVEFFIKQKESTESVSSSPFHERELSDSTRASEPSPGIQNTSSASTPPTLSSREETSQVDNSHESTATPDLDAGSLPSNQSVDDLERLDGHIRVKVKYLNDEQRWVHARPDDTVGHFKREHFASELAEDKVVRIIFNGQELREDGSTLTSYRLVDSSVVHCFMTENRTASEPQAAPNQNSEIDVGSLMFPLFGLILVLIWYCRVTYRSYFNATSTFALLGITFLFMISFLGSWRMHRAQEYEN